MPAPITEFVDVNVLLAGASADKFSFGALMGVFTFAGADRQYGPFFSQAEVVAASLGSAAAEAWAGIVFSQDDGVDQVIIGRRDAGDANWTATMDAIEAEDSESWYITNIESRVDADLNEVAAWTEARRKIFVGQSDDLAGLVAFTAWNTAGYNRSAGIYHATDAEYLDGAWSSSGGGLNLDTPGGVGVWAFRELEAVPFDPVTGAQATSLYAIGANLFGRNKSLSFTSKGTMAAGEPRFIDVTTTIDWVVTRIEEAILSLFVGTPTKIPYTNAGINIIVGVIQDVLTRGVTFGHFSPDFPPTVTAPDISEVDQADKQARVLKLQAEAVIAGAIQKVGLTLNLTF